MAGPNPGLTASFGKCLECGFMHPPTGGKCPMALEKQGPKTDEDVAEISINKFLNNMRVQLGVKVKIQKIKNFNNLFMYLSTELSKLMDNYHE